MLALAACGDDPVDTAGDSDVAAADSDDAAPDSDVAPDDVAPDSDASAPLCSTVGAGPARTLDEVAADGPFFAGYVELSVTDPDRPTAAHGIFPEAAGRTIGLRVWYPAEKGALGDLTPQLLAPLARGDGPFPMLVHSHGFSSNKDELSYAAEWLATRGWVVVELEFPLTNLTTAGGPVFEDIVHQPADVSFAIDQMLARNDLADSPFFHGIDPARIALSGVSLGGLTTLLLTYHRDWHDPRVKAAIDIAGPGAFFTPTFYSFVSLPVLGIYGDTDAIVDYSAHALPVRARAPSGTRLLTLAGASHPAFAGAASFFESSDNPDEIGCGAITGELPDNDAFLRSMADPAVGIESLPLPAPCTMDPLPHAMRPSRQMFMTRLAIYAWLELHLATDASERASACALINALDAEDDATIE